MTAPASCAAKAIAPDEVGIGALLMDRMAGSSTNGNGVGATGDEG